MNNPRLYSRGNNAHRYEIERIAKKYSSVFQWRSDGKDSLLDVGTGSGDALMDFIHPLIPLNFHKIVCSDICPKMVQYCETAYSHMDRVHFKILDIETATLPGEFISEFDHVTSFFCFNWVQNLRQAVENVFQMLRTGGDCLLVFASRLSIFESYRSVSLIPKWAPYMTDANHFITQYQDCEDPGDKFRQLLEHAGFDYIRVETPENEFDYNARQDMENIVTAINPFLDRIPPEMHKEYIDVLVQHSNIRRSQEDRYGVSYKMVIAYARKC